VFTRSTHRPAVGCVLACALLVSATTGAAAARPVQDTSASAAPAHARSYSTWGSFESIDPNRPAAKRSDVRSPDVRDAAATAREQDLRRLRAGGHAINAPGATAVDSATRRSLPGPPTWPVNPQPISPAPAVHGSDSGDGIDWTTIGLGIAAALAIAAASATGLRRLRIRRRRAARVAT
jgi:hypothetical protein